MKSKFSTGLATGFALLALNGCVQQKMEKQLTFEVDMRGVPEFGTVGIRGEYSPLSWWESVPLTDPDGDSIYTVSLLLETGQSGMDFKFETDGNLELCGSPNRDIRFTYSPETLTYRGVYNQEPE